MPATTPMMMPAMAPAPKFLSPPPVDVSPVTGELPKLSEEPAPPPVCTAVSVVELSVVCVFVEGVEVVDVSLVAGRELLEEGLAVAAISSCGSKV